LLYVGELPLTDGGHDSHDGVGKESDPETV